MTRHSIVTLLSVGAATVVCALGFVALDAQTSEGWRATSSYPGPINGQSCVTSDGHIICVGGVRGSFVLDYDSAFIAPIADGVVGAWQETTLAPDGGLQSHSCVTWEGHIYCLGGKAGHPHSIHYLLETQIIYPQPSGHVHFAPLNTAASAL